MKIRRDITYSKKIQTNTIRNAAVRVAQRTPIARTAIFFCSTLHMNTLNTRVRMTEKKRALFTQRKTRSSGIYGTANALPRKNITRNRRTALESHIIGLRGAM